MSTEPTIRKSTHDLALLIASNVGAAQLPEEVEAYFLGHKQDVIPAIRRGFILSGQETTVAEPTVQPVAARSTLFNASETDLDWWIGQVQGFAKKHLGVIIDLRERFAIPTILPWKSVIPVFDPGGLTNRGMIKRALKNLRLAVHEETDVMNYAGAEAFKEPTLHLIENSIRPNERTMGMSPDQLVGTGEPYLRLRGYGLAFAARFLAKNDYLDPETFTWFPQDRLSDDRVAHSGWNPGDLWVGFYWGRPDRRNPGRGARVAIPVPLNP
jgi:hypothetical protein